MVLSEGESNHVRFCPLGDHLKCALSRIFCIPLHCKPIQQKGSQKIGYLLVYLLVYRNILFPMVFLGIRIRISSSFALLIFLPYQTVSSEDKL